MVESLARDKETRRRISSSQGPERSATRMAACPRERVIAQLAGSDQATQCTRRLKWESSMRGSPAARKTTRAAFGRASRPLSVVQPLRRDWVKSSLRNAIRSAVAHEALAALAAANRRQPEGGFPPREALPSLWPSLQILCGRAGTYVPLAFLVVPCGALPSGPRRWVRLGVRRRCSR
jgi:hypothetical protein